MNVALRIAFSVGAIGWAEALCAQPLNNRSHATIWGDALSGRAELAAAEGWAAERYAAAEERALASEREFVKLEREWAELRREQQAAQRAERERRIADRLQRRKDWDAEQDDAARALLEGVQQGAYSWPAALQRSEYEAALAGIDSRLAEWGLTYRGTHAGSRLAVANDARRLARSVAADTEIPFNERVEAVRVLKLIERLPALSSPSYSGPTEVFVRALEN
jgi:hypothetical protein